MTREQFYLSKPEREHLTRILTEIPALTADLAVAITMQARLGERGRNPKRNNEQPLPLNLGAEHAAYELQQALHNATRDVCTQRQIVYIPAGYTHLHGDFIGPLRPWQRRTPADGYDPYTIPKLARWLKINMMSLCLTDTAARHHGRIDNEFKHTMRVVWPPFRPVVLNMKRVEEARTLTLTASKIVELAPQLGEEYRNLTVRRIQYLDDIDKIAPVPGPWAWIAHYPLGEVLDAHLLVPVRRKHAAML